MYPTHARNQGAHTGPLRLVFFSQVTNPLNARPQGKTPGQSETGVTRDVTSFAYTRFSPPPCLAPPRRRNGLSPKRSVPASDWLSRELRPRILPPPSPLGAPTAAGGTERAGAALPLSAGGPPSLLPSLPSPSPLPSSGPRVFLPHAPSLAERSPVRAFLVPQAAGRARPCSALAAPARSIPPSPGARGEPAALPPAPRRPRGAEATPHPAA